MRPVKIAMGHSVIPRGASAGRRVTAAKLRSRSVAPFESRFRADGGPLRALRSVTLTNMCRAGQSRPMQEERVVERAEDALESPVVIVRAGAIDRFAALRAAFAPDGVDVIWDRRVVERRRAPVGVSPS